MLLKSVIYLLIACLLTSFTDVDDEENPAVVYNVNVVTGSLQLSIQDSVVGGAKNLQIPRTYTSFGALEREEDNTDLELKNLKNGFIIQGGWSLLSQTHALIICYDSSKSYKAYISDVSGGLTPYVFAAKEGSHHVILRPKPRNGKSFGKLSGKSNQNKNYFRINEKTGKATLHLPDGSVLHYSGKKFLSHGHRVNRNGIFYTLDTEELPSGHKNIYSYDKKDRIQEIRCTNLNQTKTFSSIRARLDHPRTPYQFSLDTSDGHRITYEFQEFSDRDYLSRVIYPSGDTEEFEYAKNRKGIGARVVGIKRNGRSERRISYYLPKDKKEEEKWRHHPDKKSLSADKVSKIEGPVNNDNIRTTLAYFSYFPGLTKVTDSENVTTCFYHENGHLNKIEYLNEQDEVDETTLFLWDNGNMVAKVRLDRNRSALFSKTFQYDSAGNVTQETFWGDLSGQGPPPFQMNKDGSLQNCPSYTKKFSYDTERNLLITEEEDSGLSYEYGYVNNTNLLKHKLTLYDGKIFLREFFFYDADNLLYRQFNDDGTRSEESDLTGVTERKIQSYTLNPSTGLVDQVLQLYLDIESQTERLIQRTEKKYSSDKKVIEEAIYDSSNQYRYTVYIDYDRSGRITKTTSPLGQPNTYLYDPFGSLISAKEAGYLKKEWVYDPMGRSIEECEIDTEGMRRSTHLSYDAKGRLISKTDPQWNTTYQTYDSKGRCTQSILPSVEDEQGLSYCPTITYGYDGYGNLSRTTTPSGASTWTDYTALRKPILITHPDGGQTQHIYASNETRLKTTHPDGTHEDFVYDHLKRMIKKTVVGCDGQILEEESWDYNTLHLVSYTDPAGLTTYYNYDGMGRLIMEKAEESCIYYTYDSLGFLEKKINNDTTYITIHDVEGRLIKHWVEDQNGRQEELMESFYDAENRKIQSHRYTSQGIAQDTFSYDPQGRLCSHTDPLGNTCQFIFTETQNRNGQTVLQKKTIDPLGLIQIETFDAQKRPVEKVHMDPLETPTGGVSIFYDRDGNKAKQLSRVIRGGAFHEDHVIDWEYDSCSRMICEIESGCKTTSLEYDTKGRMIKKTLPSGIEFVYEYDGLDRLLYQKSNDGSVEYLYQYGKERHPRYIYDRKQGISLERGYDLFGRIISEKSSDQMSYFWRYDRGGRCICFTLPDSSSILYHYSGLHMDLLERRTQSGLILQHRYTEFDPTGHVVEAICIDGTVLNKEYDLLERLVAEKSPYYSAHFTYGPSGLVTDAFHSLTKHTHYEYDSLSQLRQEGQIVYDFDSLGNPSQGKMGPCNELLEYQGRELSYDPHGRLLQKVDGDKTLQYEYDALGRLIQITDQNNQITRLYYDPLSRLVGKKTEKGFEKFLYNQQTEIGSLDAKGTIKELKILGLGLEGDVAAAVGLELQGEIFIPIHDLTGNIIAAASCNGKVEGVNEMDAFGRTVTSIGPTLSPWGFSSKRSICGLVNFGLRFYDPQIGRWITPDPMGYADGSNLYAYVMNSPTNRLDLFGLFGQPFPSDFGVQVEVPLHLLQPQTMITPFRQAEALRGSINGVEVDWLVKGGNWSKLNFSAEELQKEKINLFDHIHEIIPPEGKIVGFLSFQNGIQTSLDETKQAMKTFSTFIPNDSLMLSLYSPSKGLLSDVNQACDEMANTKETQMTALTRQYFTAASTTLFNINPEAVWIHIAHSRGGGIATRAVEGMSEEQLGMMKKNFLYLGIAPSVPMSRNHALNAVNIYSTHDPITGWMGKKFAQDPNYIIEFVTCQLPKHKWLPSSLRIDHSLMGPTYRQQSQTKLRNIHKTIGTQNAIPR